MNIILYSTGCPKCTVLKKKLDSLNLSYQIITDKTTMKNLNFTHVPVLEVDGKRMNFMDANNWIKSKEGDND